MGRCESIGGDGGDPLCVWPIRAADEEPALGELDPSGWARGPDPGNPGDGQLGRHVADAPALALIGRAEQELGPRAVRGLLGDVGACRRKEKGGVLPR